MGFSAQKTPGHGQEFFRSDVPLSWGLSLISWLAAHSGAESALFMAEKEDKLPHLRFCSHPHPPLHLGADLPLLFVKGMSVNIQRSGYLSMA